MKKIISLILSVSIITNTLSWAYYVTLINMVLTPRVYAANEIYESLENTFDLSNPLQTEPQRLRQIIFWKNIRVVKGFIH
jgi:hypothetical protein